MAGEGKSQTVEANYDGSHKVTMCTGDRIRIVQSEKITEFIQLNQVSFLDVLHRKNERFLTNCCEKGMRSR